MIWQTEEHVKGFVTPGTLFEELDLIISDQLMAISG